MDKLPNRYKDSPKGRNLLILGYPSAGFYNGSWYIRIFNRYEALGKNKEKTLTYLKISLRDLIPAIIRHKMAFSPYQKTSEFEVLATLNASPVAFALFSDLYGNLRVIDKVRKAVNQRGPQGRGGRGFNIRPFYPGDGDADYRFHETVFEFRRKKILLRSEFHLRKVEMLRTGFQLSMRYHKLGEVLVNSSRKSARRHSGEISLRILLDEILARQGTSGGSDRVGRCEEEKFVGFAEKPDRVDPESKMDVFLVRIQPGYLAACFGERNGGLSVAPYSLKEGKFLREVTFWMNQVFDAQWRLVKFGEYLLAVGEYEVKRLDFRVQETDQMPKNRKCGLVDKTPPTTISKPFGLK